MTTKLIPPNITPGPWRALESEYPQWKVVGREGEFHFICITVQKDDEARAKFIAAAPAMAEALLDMLDTHKDDRNSAWCRASHTAAIEALLEAGYTLAPVDAE